MAKSIIPKDSRYIPLTQQRWCCVPTCIQMVMLRHGIPLIPAELIAHYLGLIVPEEELKYFWEGRTGEKPHAGWGTQINKEEFSPNQAFKVLNIPLQMQFNLIDNFSDTEVFKEYLGIIEKEDKNVLVCYDWGTLFDVDYRGGHVCVIDRVYLDKGNMRIIDPEYKAPKWRVVGIDKMFKAMIQHGAANSGGFWKLEKKVWQGENESNLR